MIFCDYVYNELKDTPKLCEAILKFGPDVQNGAIRRNHYETNNKNTKIIIVNGFRTEVPISATEKTNRKRGAIIAQKKRNAKMSKIQLKRRLAYQRRRAMNMQQDGNTLKHQ